MKQRPLLARLGQLVSGRRGDQSVLARAAMQTLEERRLLAAPDLSPVSPVTTVTDNPIYIPLQGSDADGDDLNYEVTSVPEGFTAEIVDPNNTWIEIDVRDYGTMTFQLFDDLAPDTVRRITGLIESGWYDGLQIPRIVEDFVIQFGSPNNTTSGGPDFTFDDEFSEQALFTGTGQLAMANSGKDTNGSQLFITQGPVRTLDLNHTVFGQIVEGQDVLAAINDVETIELPAGEGGYDTPVTPIVIDSISVIENNSDAVLKITPTSSTTGTITVRATANGESDSVDIQVTAQNDTVDSPAIFESFPTRFVTDVNTPITFNVPALDPEGDALDYVVQLFGDTTGSVTVDEDDQTVTYTPGSGYTGQAQIVVQVRDASALSRGSTADPFDRQTVLVGVGDEAATITGRSLDAVADTVLNNVVVATFTDADPDASASDWSADIDWGDGDVTEGTIVENDDGSFSVVGSHTYEQAGELPLTVTIEGDLGASAVATGMVDVTSTADIDDEGLVRVNGGSGEDAIGVERDGDIIRVTVNGQTSEFDITEIHMIEIFAGDGDDLIEIGEDLFGVRVFAGAGNDTVTSGNGNDEIFGEAGDDELFSGGGNDSVEGGAGADYLMGGTELDVSDAQFTQGYFDRDTLEGGDGNDTLSGGLDQNFLFGGAGDDLLNGSGGRDSLDGGDGNDRLRGYGNADILAGGIGNDTLEGDAADGPRGGSSVGAGDLLIGNAGNDILFGRFGADIFEGGDGADSLFGGDGNDIDNDEDEDDILDSIEL